MPYEHSFVIITMVMLVANTYASSPRGNAMRFVPIPERERSRAKLSHQVDKLKVLVSRTGADNGDLETTGKHLSAAIETLNRHRRIEVEMAQAPVVQGAQEAALDAATLGAATALQEAIASLDLMRLRTGVMPSQSEFRDLAHRLALADAAFRFVAVGVRRSRLLPSEPGRRRDFWQTLRNDWAALGNFGQKRPGREVL